MAATRMISIIGLKNAGKTTFLVALAAEMARREFRVMTIKHGTHTPDMDQRGKDTWRHWHEGRAERVLMESPGQRVLFERTQQESDPITLARRYLTGADIVLAEGFKKAPLPKIEVYRRVAGPKPIFDPEKHDPADWVAMVTDDT
ncbi:MAG TPA: molybdopterin-guanine dinucleotide biosynthesis protein B, partial [Gemmatimonadales bacterium]|nr:molybdopterin-guanine dinucleotide biosynthesis protein B [Gemmatimonadales bacterium]